MQMTKLGMAHPRSPLHGVDSSHHGVDGRPFARLEVATLRHRGHRELCTSVGVRPIRAYRPLAEHEAESTPRMQMDVGGKPRKETMQKRHAGNKQEAQLDYIVPLWSL